MVSRFLVALLVAWVALPALGPGAVAEPVFMPGMRIGLEPPGDLKLSRQFPGFEDADRKVKITILDLPAGAYEEVERSAFSTNQRGLTGVKRESFPFANGVGILLTGQAQDNGIAVDRWFLLASAVGSNSPTLATLINVEVPVAARAVYPDAIIRKALASVTFRPAPLEEQLNLMPFKLGNLAGFRVMQALQEGAVILTDGPTDDLSKQPYMIVSIGRGSPVEPGERGRFARDLLASAPLRDLTVQSAEAMRIGGGQGYEIRAKATGPRGDAVFVVQWLRFGGGGYLRIVGLSSQDAWDQMFTRFRAVRDGIEPR